MTWLQGASVVDLSARGFGQGPFSNFLGVILHVNDAEDGTGDDFYEAAGTPTNPDSVVPNFQVYKDGTVHQYLPFDWQPWAQENGNANYAAIETAGLPTEPLTSQQITAIATILTAYKTQMGMSLTLANAPGQKGLGTHEMGGAAWGGHPCPGDIRTAQRQQILTLASQGVPVPFDAAEQQYLAQMKADILAAINHATGLIINGDGIPPAVPDSKNTHPNNLRFIRADVRGGTE